MLNTVKSYEILIIYEIHNIFQRVLTKLHSCFKKNTHNKRFSYDCKKEKEIKGKSKNSVYVTTACNKKEWKGHTIYETRIGQVQIMMHLFTAILYTQSCSMFT